MTPERGTRFRLVYQCCGWFAVALGFAGVFLPLLPTVPFMLLAAFCFGRSNPALEARLLRDPRFGPHILAWRARGAVSRKAKLCAVAGFAVSAVIGLLLVAKPWGYIPLAIGTIGSLWIIRRPEH
jgi:uncharacterized membrane protein YbaN (DUF454 family)